VCTTDIAASDMRAQICRSLSGAAVAAAAAASAAAAAAAGHQSAEFKSSPGAILARVAPWLTGRYSSELVTM
jgi:hypothetical protein